MRIMHFKQQYIHIYILIPLFSIGEETNMANQLVHQLNQAYTPAHRGGIQLLDFTVPEDITHMTIDIEDLEKHNFLDYALRSPDGFHGWSGCTKTHIVISEEYATSGYLPKIPSGTWQLVIGYAKINAPSETNVTVTLTPKESKWYCGDLHMHSIHSDGDFTISKVMDNAYDEGLDFIALTDHNTFTQNKESAPTNRKLTVIPGIEITTYGGHFNIINLEHPLTKVLCHTQEDVDEVMEEGKKGNTIVSINHSFCVDKWSWKMDPYPLDFIEIWNSGWKTGNMECIHFWQRKLAEGHIIHGIGGSDTHRKDGRWYGQPTTWVKAEGNNITDIIDGLRTGQISVSINPQAPHVDLSIENTSMGRVYSKNDKALITLNCSILNPVNCKLRLYSSAGLIKTQDLDSITTDLSFELSTTSLFYRIELWEKYGNVPLCFSNPIYIR